MKIQPIRSFNEHILRKYIATAVMAVTSLAACSKVEIMSPDQQEKTKTVYDESMNNLRPLFLMDSLGADMGILDRDLGLSIKVASFDRSVIEIDGEDGREIYLGFEKADKDIIHDTLSMRMVVVKDNKQLESVPLKIYNNNGLLTLENSNTKEKMFELRRRTDHSWDAVNNQGKIVAQWYNYEPKTYIVQGDMAQELYKARGYVKPRNEIHFNPTVDGWKDGGNVNCNI